MNEALALRDLHFGYGRHAAVRGVSLQLEEGDCYGFLGHNGAGKTTVMRLCLGLLRPSSGDVRIFGVDPARNRRSANALLGALIERPGFHPHVSARQNLILLARLQGIARRLAPVEADRVIECVGLSDASKRRVGTYSMGMRQRLGIAQALLGKPRLLLLDEPTNGLDPEGIAELRTLLQQLTRDEGVAVMLSSHQLAELEGLCNRIGVLREGSMVVEGDLESLRRTIGIRHAITGSPIDVLQTELRAQQLEPTRKGDHLLVDLGEASAASVVRALATKADLTSFAPEQATLERIYLHAAAHPADAPTPAAQPASTESPPTQASTSQTAPKPSLGRTDRARRRAFAYEASTMLQRRSSLLLLLAPCAVGAYGVHRYSSGVREGLALVETGERFSADAGSGYLAMAQGLQTATPVLALALLWLSSQSIAGDLNNDTLRNALTRSLRRRDMLFGKVFVLLAMMVLAWLTLLATTAISSWSTVGFGDLEEVTRFGDRELLAPAGDVWPTLFVAISQMLLPLGAIVLLGAAASALAKRPALALAAAALFVLLPEVVRGMLGEHGGWLLTSHLPIAWRDDSGLAYLAAVSRGAADALWIWADQATTAPVAWLVAGTLLLGVLIARMRIR